ncbi:MAG: LD-carboxypeptidase [Deltaproteobacteria bacterium]|nr:LD-carboxypeptidase [Deltaproteobacteria bacterium]
MAQLIKPQPLKTGATVGVLAPAGFVAQAQLSAGVDVLLRAGFRVELAHGIGDQKGYLAGEAKARAAALQAFFCRPDIEAIFCARGGFGSIQLLPFLDPSVIRMHPKIFVGYSDVSVLLNWLIVQCGIVTFHGPMVAMDLARGLEGRAQEFFWGTLTGKKDNWEIETSEIIRPGNAEGEMLGGCLSVIVTTLGTPYEIETQGKILFLEDVGEKPYRIERMLTHLLMAGKFADLAALVFGAFADCEGEEERGFKKIIQELFREAPYPVIAGLAAGHGAENLLLPFGVRMALNADSRTLVLLESPVA